MDEKPLLAPDPAHPEEVWGCEDPRLVYLPERKEWAITYTAYSNRGPLVSLAMTKDFREVRRLGPVMPPDDKDAALFPRLFDGRWIMIHRPAPFRPGPHLDLILARPAPLGRSRGSARGPRRRLVGCRQDRARAAAACHFRGLAGHVPRRPHDCVGSDIPRRAGIAGPRAPEIVLRRSDEWVMAPTTNYESVGDVDKVVFPNGWVLDEAPIASSCTTAQGTPSAAWRSRPSAR
jgi:beta-1,4-mannooligosaccharide/beta-1,4-mannosyl-N-acetylglucosamine phosphorylase